MKIRKSPTESATIGSGFYGLLRTLLTYLIIVTYLR